MRRVHYAAHGTGGWATPCYHERLREHLASRIETTVLVAKTENPYLKTPPRFHLVSHVNGTAVYERRTVAEPRRSTDLTKVTCDTCWRQILERARIHFASAWPAVIATTR